MRRPLRPCRQPDTLVRSSLRGNRQRLGQRRLGCIVGFNRLHPRRLRQPPALPSSSATINGVAGGDFGCGCCALAMWVAVPSRAGEMSGCVQRFANASASASTAAPCSPRPPAAPSSASSASTSASPATPPTSSPLPCSEALVNGLVGAAPLRPPHRLQRRRRPGPLVLRGIVTGTGFGASGIGVGGCCGSGGFGRPRLLIGPAPLIAIWPASC